MHPIKLWGGYGPSSQSREALHSVSFSGVALAAVGVVVCNAIMPWCCDYKTQQSH